MQTNSISTHAVITNIEIDFKFTIDVITNYDNFILRWFWKRFNPLLRIGHYSVRMTKISILK